MIDAVFQRAAVRFSRIIRLTAAAVCLAAALPALPAESSRASAGPGSRTSAAAIAHEQQKLARQLPPGERYDVQMRLLELYDNSGDYLALFSFLDECAAAAATRRERLGWLLESADRYVSLDIPVRAYEYHQQITAVIDSLPAEQRRSFVSAERYQRLNRYVTNLLSLDVRSTMIFTLLDRALEDPATGGWYYIQAANLHRCRLEYGKAEQLFAEGIQSYPAYYPLRIESAFLQYRLSRFSTAISIFSNLVLFGSADLSAGALGTDWRYRSLDMLARDRTPPPREALLDWARRHQSRFASPGRFYNYTANVFAAFAAFDQATNAFYRGISADPLCLDNYLDLGYQFCRQGDIAKTGDLIDALLELDVPVADRQFLRYDWRFIQLFYFTGRPFDLPE